jgi:hypothetical protein
LAYPSHQNRQSCRWHLGAVGTEVFAYPYF